MSKIVVDDDGKEETVYTQAEMDAIKADADAKLKDKDTHFSGKLDEFAKAKAIQDAKDTERDAKAAEIKATADAALAKAAESEGKHLLSLKNAAMKKYTGEDPTLKAKFDESWALVNLEIKDDEDVLKKAEMVANMAGLNNAPDVFAGDFSMSGGHAPTLSAAEKEKKSAEHNQFKSALGLEDFIIKPEEKKQ